MTKKQHLWEQYYSQGCSAEEAARRAGYGSSYRKMGRYNLENYEKRINDPELQLPMNGMISLPEQKYNDPVADVREITAFWTGILRDENADLKDKLKVSELLAKTRGAFSAKDGEEEITETDGYETLSLEEKLKLIERIRTGDSDA